VLVLLLGLHEAKSLTAINTPIRNLPFDRNSTFVGREQIFAKLDGLFIETGESQPRVALCGLGGVG
jgi:hypothetical protein